MSANGSDARLDRIEKLIEQSEVANKKAHARLDRDLRRWAALGIKEARRQRKRAQEIDESITRLASAQLVTEEKLQRFISTLGRGRNGGKH
jgi:hypothetical protein